MISYNTRSNLKLRNPEKIKYFKGTQKSLHFQLKGKSEPLKICQEAMSISCLSGSVLCNSPVQSFLFLFCFSLGSSSYLNPYKFSGEQKHHKAPKDNIYFSECRKQRNMRYLLNHSIIKIRQFIFNAQRKIEMLITMACPLLCNLVREKKKKTHENVFYMII